MSDTPQQLIDIGAVNDGTGESLRDAFQAVNNNFANVWTAGPVNSQVQISNNRVSTNETNLDLVLAGNGVGNVTVASTVVPNIDSVYDLGSANRYFDSTYSRYYYGNGRFLTGIAGGGAGNGTAIANGTSNVSVLAANSNITVGINGTGNVVVFASDQVTFAANLAPAANITYDLGSDTARWRDLYLSNSTIYLGSAQISANADSLILKDPTGDQTTISAQGLVSSGNVVGTNFV